MYVAIIAGIVIIASSIFITYSNEQGTVRGKIFGEELQIIQEDLKKLTHTFDSNVSMFKDGSLTKEGFLKLTKNHIKEMKLATKLFGYSILYLFMIFTFILIDKFV